MTKTKTTKRALLSSALALLLCVSMLVGTTFAWFTDSVTSGSNIIRSGNLDVELEYWNGSAWKDVKEATDVLTGDLWEPGYTDIAYLRLKNAGSLALKYALSVNIASETPGINKDAEPFKLSDYIYFDVAQDVNGESGAFADRAAAMAIATETTKISAGYAKSGVLPANTGYTYLAMVVYMPEWVGNVANHNGTDLPAIDLGINVFATQFTKEEDSFDEYYDQYTAVFSVDEANAMLAAGKDVTLVNCIDPDGVLTVPAGYKGTLTLQNTTIASVQELSAGTFALRAAQAPAETTATKIVILGNVEIKATEPGMSAITGKALHISGNGHLTAVGNGHHAYGIGGDNTTSIVIEDITVDYVSGGHAYGVGTDTDYYKDAPEGGAAIGSGCDGAVIVLDNVTVTKAIGGSKAAAIGARYHTGVTVNITDSVIGYAEGGVSAAGIGSSRVSNGATESGTTVNITGSTVTAKGGAYGAGIGSGYDTHCQSSQPLCTVNITDSVIAATGGRRAAGIGTGYHTAALAGEIKNSTVTAVSGEKFYKADGKYTLAMDIGFGIINLSKEGVQADSAIIVDGEKVTIPAPVATVSSTEDLKAALQAGKDVCVSADTYTFPAASFTASSTVLCEEGTVFEGNSKLNINGATVVGATFSNPTGTAVDQTINGTFKDCTFTGSNGLRWCYAGENVVFENCVFDGAVYGVHFDGGANSATFRNCTFSGFNAFGSALKMLTLEGCTFKANGRGNYNGVNLWGNTTATNCTFVFDGSVGNEWVDVCGDNTTCTFTNCVVSDGTATRGVETVVGDYGVGNTIIVNGKTVTEE